MFVFDANSSIVSDNQQQQSSEDDFVVYGDSPKERQCSAVIDEATAERTNKVPRPEYAQGGNNREGCKPRITNGGYASLDLAKLKLKAFKRETRKSVINYTLRKASQMSSFFSTIQFVCFLNSFYCVRVRMLSEPNWQACFHCQLFGRQGGRLDARRKTSDQGSRRQILDDKDARK